MLKMSVSNLNQVGGTDRHKKQGGVGTNFGVRVKRRGQKGREQRVWFSGRGQPAHSPPSIGESRSAVSPQRSPGRSPGRRRVFLHSVTPNCLSWYLSTYNYYK